MPEMTLSVNGRDYGGWKSADLTLGIEAMACSFHMGVSDRWDGQRTVWPIREEDACEVKLDGAPMLDGFIDTRSHAFDAEGHEISFDGRDPARELVDCSADLDDTVEFAHIGVLELSRKVAEPFGLTVRLQNGLRDKAISTSGAGGGSSRKLTRGAPQSVGSAGTSSSLQIGSPNVKLTINPGDSPFEIIDRACRMVGMLPVSDGFGGIVLTRAGGDRATTSLVEGQNILHGTSRFDCTRRYRRYVVTGQQGGNDETFGPSAAHVRAEAVDRNVRRDKRVLVIRPDGNVTLAFARNRAGWEATVRAARSAGVQITVQGWRQPDGSLWPRNALVPVHSPTLDVSGEMLIAETTFSIAERQGTTTTLTLVRPDAYIPEPTLDNSKSSGDAAFRSFLG